MDTQNETPEYASPEPCTHRYVIEPADPVANGGEARKEMRGVCRYCGAERMFSPSPMSQWQYMREAIARPRDEVPA